MWRQVAVADPRGESGLEQQEQAAVTRARPSCLNTALVNQCTARRNKLLARVLPPMQHSAVTFVKRVQRERRRLLAETRVPESAGNAAASAAGLLQVEALQGA